MPPPVPGNDTSEDYSDYQNDANDDGVPQIPTDPRFIVENRARGAVPKVNSRPPPRPTSSSAIRTTTEEPSQNRGQDLRQPVTPRPRARTPPPPVQNRQNARLAPTARPSAPRPVPVPATRPVEAPRSFAATPQPRPNTLDAFSAFQTPFDFPRARIEEIERNRPGQEPADPVAPAAPVPARPIIEEITTRRPIRIQAARQPEQQSFISRQRQQEPSQPTL